ncbi:MAG: hypothetical protein KDC33_04815 [Thermoleophilia bacterium]|nr:hypothetical protein [Thermoleophilia bacterium]
MAIYLSFRPVQPFAKIETEELADPAGVRLVRGDGQVVGIHLAENKQVLLLPRLIDEYELPEDLVWMRLRGDDDVLLGRRGLHTGNKPR